MPSTDRKLELTAKSSMAQPVSQPALCCNGLTVINPKAQNCSEDHLCVCLLSALILSLLKLQKRVRSKEYAKPLSTIVHKSPLPGATSSVLKPVLRDVHNLGNFWVPLFTYICGPTAMSHFWATSEVRARIFKNFQHLASSYNGQV